MNQGARSYGQGCQGARCGNIRHGLIFFLNIAYGKYEKADDGRKHQQQQFRADFHVLKHYFFLRPILFSHLTQTKGLFLPPGGLIPPVPGIPNSQVNQAPQTEIK